MATGARSVVVNRTHRVVREQALTLREQKSRVAQPVGAADDLFDPDGGDLLRDLGHAGWI